MGTENRWSYDAATERFKFLNTEERTGTGGGAYQFTDWEREQPGAQYQGKQHSAFEGDSCYGDAGGSVWKLWTFRDPQSSDKTWNKKYKNQELAVLTGVISRYLSPDLT